MRSFGAKFPYAKFLAAWNAKREDPVEAKRVNLVNWGVSAVSNHLNTVIQAGAALDGLREPHENVSAPSDFNRLADAGVISANQRRRLARLNHVRNSIQHSYGLNAKPDEVHEGAQIAVGALNTFTDDYGDWLCSLDILPPAR